MFPSFSFNCSVCCLGPQATEKNPARVTFELKQKSSKSTTELGVEPPGMLQNAPQRGFHLQPRHLNLSYATFALKDDGPLWTFGGTVSCSKVEHKYSDEPSQTVEQANKCLKEPPTCFKTPTLKSVKISLFGQSSQHIPSANLSPQIFCCQWPQVKTTTSSGSQDVGGSVELMDSCWLRW